MAKQAFKNVRVKAGIIPRLRKLAKSNRLTMGEQVAALVMERIESSKPVNPADHV